MKPHPPYPRIRKTIKWGGAALTVLLVVVWLWSGWLEPQSNRLRRTSDIGVSDGAVYYAQSNALFSAPDAYFFRFGQDTPRMRWWFVVRSTVIGWRAAMPLWIPALGALSITALAFRLDTLARRRARIGYCPKCHYDRAGIASDAVCPECGAATRAGRA